MAKTKRIFQKNNLLEGRIAVVTGATSGIGKSTAAGLASMGAEVILPVREVFRGNSAMEEIKDVSGSRKVRMMIADLASLESVDRFCETLKREIQELHILVNNAATVPLERSLSVDGIELQFAVNFLAHYRLTNNLLPLLKKGAPSRILHISSAMHKKGAPDLSDLQFEIRKYSGIQAYSDTKMMNLLYSNHLAVELAGSGVTSNSIHPGVVNTGIYRNIPEPLKSMMTFFMMKPSKGAATSIYAASAPELIGVTGAYFVKKRAVEPTLPADRESLGEKIFHYADDLIQEARGGKN